MTQKLRILIVEDEPAIRTGLIDVLVYHGYEVDFADDGLVGLEKALTGQFDLVLLDVMLPSMNGFDICERIRQQDKEQAIMMLTAKTSDDDIIQGLRLGADDYVSKPFSVVQLVLRVQAVLRRSEAGRRQQQAQHIHLGQSSDAPMTIDVLNLSACFTDVDSCAATGETTSSKKEEVSFTRREMDVLMYLHTHKERAVSREELLNKVWGYDKDLGLETRTVDIHIAKLRRKIEPQPKQPCYLVTVRGAGYRLVI